MEKLDLLRQIVNSKYSHVIIAGDINVNVLENSNDSDRLNYFKFLFSILCCRFSYKIYQHGGTHNYLTRNRIKIPFVVLKLNILEKNLCRNKILQSSAGCITKY